MKIWCTYRSVGSLVSSGLANVQVWFAKPQWLIETKQYWYDSPFDDGIESHTRGVIDYQGWYVEFTSGDKFERHWLSFGKAFGYGDSKDPQVAELAQHIWTKLSEHFTTDNIYLWEDRVEKNKIYPQTFCLEIDLNLAFNHPTP